MCALAHVLEREGIATITIVTKARRFAELIRPPRTLFCEFPLGRPLGRPRDPAFQHRVLRAGFELLDSRTPVIHDFPERIDDGIDDALACTIPPSVAVGVAPSVGEARGLRAASMSAASRGIGLGVDFDVVESSLAAFERVAAGVPWRDAAFPMGPQRCALLVRAFYEQAAIGLNEGAGGARAAETWFATRTLAGGVLHSARDAMRAAGEPESVSRFLLSEAQQGEGSA